MKLPSLGRYLWRWTLAALAAAWLALMIASYFAGLHEANEIADGHLASAANVLLQLPSIGSSGGVLANGYALDEDSDGQLIPSGRHLKLARSVAVLVWERGQLVSDTRAPEQRGTWSSPTAMRRPWCSRVRTRSRIGGARSRPSAWTARAGSQRWSILTSPHVSCGR